MATVMPCVDALRNDAGLYRELDVLERLELSLPDGYLVFHSVLWHEARGDGDRHGEIDLVVLAPCGNILLIEVKAGTLELTEGRLIKLYGRERHDVARQTRMQFSTMARRLDECGLSAYLSNCLVLPDFRIEDSAEVVSIPRERIIDATGFEQLGSRVLEMLTAGMTRSGHEALRQFLANEFRVAPDLRVLDQQLRRTAIRLADGLATWAPRITSPSGVLCIQATAGSGKTQLALRLLEAAVGQGARAQYVCFNRTLADHFGRIAPTRAKVTSFHELCVAYYRDTHGEPDFQREGVFGELADQYCAAAEALEPTYDLVIIDEGQDFEPEWVQSLLLQLKPEGRLYFLEDAAQRLYPRDEFDLAGAATLSCQDNFRSPGAIVQLINALGLAPHRIEPKNPYQGELPGFHVYHDDRTLKRRTVEAVESLIERGAPLAEIAVLSNRGHAHSIMLAEDTIGAYRTRRFMGNYGADGAPVWSEGELRVESIYRFKGQSATAVVLTELDFDSVDDKVRSRLFVGLTRAHLMVEMVISGRAEQALKAMV